jgi:hypothetical protein
MISVEDGHVWDRNEQDTVIMIPADAARQERADGTASGTMVA